ncbi:hypothetical protein ABNB59_09245 [Paenibacillus larvae]|uniref:Uncharacterized protein n=3 Tax=Paenibacillus larvae TaxID=1464 RepID=V9W784_9BACL|nr:hypothetical protein [Paenibacillus larvae]AHD04967.1 hypothetical protein ERIC2_c11341 [Paenibacillus larvae subsp. larvae DSM 25430]AVF20809.1 hypothetical protein ERICI_00898 [Paenibacillus larvae subsp. larvae]AVG11511.1 hypothetical protein ERICII_01094 [Paenibacillus larvae subsp. larvae DSM 25430]ETK28223.1 hypothetical protein ERIC1_1c16840 [Paenibacillus larvae subsp. larvae DSM 25719]MCY7477014.1 hypothetical protein [Paenibacillus larvae]
MNIEITDVVIVAVIVGIVEMAKGIGLPVRLAPVLSVTLHRSRRCLLPG